MFFEDELLDELRSLQKGVGLLSVLGEVLVKVTKEAGVPGLWSVKSWTISADSRLGPARRRSAP